MNKRYRFVFCFLFVCVISVYSGFRVVFAGWRDPLLAFRRKLCCGGIPGGFRP